MAKDISCFEDEFSRLSKVLNFRLPHRFKKIGLIGAALVLLFLLSTKFWGDTSLVFKDALRSLMLLLLLFASLSKDLVEDEYHSYVRFQSYVLAFVVATVYSISIPLIAFVLDLLITNITGDGEVSFYEISAFEVMFTLLCFQLLFFETIKKLGRAE